MIGVLFLILIIIGCNGQYDPNHRLGASASIATTSEITDQSGNVILRRAVNTDLHWKLGTIDGVDLSKYSALADIEYKWVAGYQWKSYLDHTDFVNDRSATDVYLLVDGNGVFNGLYHATAQLTANLPTDDAAICGNENIFCWPNKKDPSSLFEKRTTNTGRPALLSRRINAGHDGLDATVHPDAKWPFRKPGECTFEPLSTTLKLSCPEYEIRGDVANNKWLKTVWNLIGENFDQPATTQKWKIAWNETTHEATWHEDGGFSIKGIRYKSDASEKKVNAKKKSFGGFHVFRDIQGPVGECVMNSVNTVLKQRYWNNQQYYDEFCAPYGGPKIGDCKSSAIKGKYRTFGVKTVDMALAKVGAFGYYIDDINQLYSQLKTDEPHHLLGIRMSYNVKGGSNKKGHLELNPLNWERPQPDWTHSTAFVWRGGTDNHWYYVNSHLHRPIHQYHNVLDMIQDIKKNFNKFRLIQVVRILAQNTAHLAATPLNVVRTRKMEDNGVFSINIQINGGGTRRRMYHSYRLGVSLAYQEYDNMYDSDTDQYKSSLVLFSQNGYDYFSYWILENEIVLLFSIISLLIVICCCVFFVLCLWIFYAKNKKRIQEFVGFV